uniref:oxoglutarate dehydrogenase (succinyl-transferring) n=1 Tax=uncultured Thiotrichaceae bacterium TaxID=298394 RepID=A0A6S6U1L2_9GAMM|nr:MAG: 2-oxoglutarate dehydrogenase E1 component (EC [uncultured Thiotrichaceae bacterium]
MSLHGNTIPSDESFLDGEHAIFLEQVYQQYQEAPDEVSAEWREYFTKMEQGTVTNGSGMVHTPNVAMQSGADYVPQSVLERRSFQVRVSQLINAYRFQGHLNANTNPLGEYGEQPEIPQLDLAYHDLDQTDPNIAFDPGSFNLTAEPTLGNIHKALKETYTRTTGFEYMHITDIEEKRWIQARIEPGMARDDMTDEQRHVLLKQLTAAEGFEQYLSRRYVGQKKFGLEGGESLIPLLHVLIQEGGREGLQEAVVGMAHRGRLNVLINLMCKPSGILFDEFDGKADEDEYTGDVKYHKGYSNDVTTPGGPVHLALAFNPSHLEIVSPVVEGSVRARQERREDVEGKEVMGIIIHGDAAFAGQGVVMETFSMAQTRGYRTHGTVHIVINNQVGFTTSTAADSRSSYYPTDAAKIVNAPIIHVNGDDPEAVVYAAKVALDYRNHFKKDIVIDLVCYRRQGHNEADEPFMTQPIMYSIIKKLKTTRNQYAEQMVSSGVVTQEVSDGLVKEYRALMDAGVVTDDFVGDVRTGHALPAELQTHWSDYNGSGWRNQVDTTCSAERIQQIAENWANSIPEDFVVHRRVKKVVDERTLMAKGEKLADWGFGETLAYAALLEDGYDVRLSGQDCGRGTFSHRHAVLHNQKERAQHIPLQHSAENQANFTVIDSLLSEEAVLAFEYGFATADPSTLVIWEAQFGDFVNGAQVVIDQFISSGEQKWQRLCGLAMFLPHGFEGQGPEHSSARLERFVQLAAQENMQIVVPSTPAQTFHMIRQQMMRTYRKPLIVMTPKSLLRHPLATNELSDFTEGKFEFVLDDADLVSKEDKAAVKRAVICSGKVYYDLLTARRKNEIKDIALIRLEQLYPFPGDEMSAVIEQYPNLEEKLWCQEEPVNQGAWDGILPRFENYCGYHDLTCVSRESAAAPAVGSAKVHLAQQQRVVRDALNLGPDAEV